MLKQALIMISVPIISEENLSTDEILKRFQLDFYGHEETIKIGEMEVIKVEEWSATQLSKNDKKIAYDYLEVAGFKLVPKSWLKGNYFPNDIESFFVDLKIEPILQLEIDSQMRNKDYRCFVIKDSDNNEKLIIVNFAEAFLRNRILKVYQMTEIQSCMAQCNKFQQDSLIPYDITNFLKENHI